MRAGKNGTMPSVNRNAALAAMARKLLAQEVGFLEGVRAICALSRGLDGRDEYPLMLFRAVESETDAFAVVNDADRHLYSEAFLARQAEKLRRYMEAEGDAVREAAEAILRHGS